MRVSKRSLRLLPVMFLLEMLVPVLNLIIIFLASMLSWLAGRQTGAITALSSGFMLLAIWMAGSVFIYEIIELSRYFRYSWYLHICFLVIKSVTMVLDGISAVMGDAVSLGTKNAYEITSDFLSSGRQLVGITALCLAMAGFRTVLNKIDEQKMSSKCRKYSCFFLITGILLTLNDIAYLILTVFLPAANTTLTAENLPIVVIYAVLHILMLIMSIPAFLTIRKSCKTIYGVLLRAQEV